MRSRARRERLDNVLNGYKLQTVGHWARAAAGAKWRGPLDGLPQLMYAARMTIRDVRTNPERIHPGNRAAQESPRVTSYLVGVRHDA